MTIIERLQNVLGCFDFGAAWFELWYQPPAKTFGELMEQLPSLRHNALAENLQNSSALDRLKQEYVIHGKPEE